jgi:hypothetical protein
MLNAGRPSGWSSRLQCTKVVLLQQQSAVVRGETTMNHSVGFMLSPMATEWPTYTAEQSATKVDIFSNSTSVATTPVSTARVNPVNVREIVLVSYLSTFVVGIIGNGFLIFVIGYFQSARNKSVANYYIWNLAFADFFFILMLPFFCYTTFFKDWPFGKFFCQLALAVRETNRFASVFTLMALSVDRYIASFYNLDKLRTVNVGRAVCVTIWLVCLAISTPYWMYASTFPKRNSHKQICMLNWPSPTYFEFWIIFQFFVALVIPFTFIIGSYIQLGRRLQRIMRSSSISRIQKPNKKMTRTVLAIVLTFLCCQTPYHMIEFWALHRTKEVQRLRTKGVMYQANQMEVDIFVYANTLAQILVFISSCCNPILYGLLNENYSKY